MMQIHYADVYSSHRLLSQHSGNSHGRCRNFPFITMSHESSGEEEEDEEGNGQLVIDEPPAKKIRKTENVLVSFQHLG